MTHSAVKVLLSETAAAQVFEDKKQSYFEKTSNFVFIIVEKF